MRKNTKYVAERVIVTFKFTAIKTSVSQPEVFIFDQKGNHVTGMLYNSPNIQNNIVTQLVEGGVGGQTYQLRCFVTVDATNERIGVVGDLLVLA